MTAGLSTPLGAHDPPRTKVTWSGDIARLVKARCIRCHAPGGKAPMSLATYEDARPWARAIREEVMARRMPKWHAARGFGQFLNDPTLSPFEIALFVAWVDGGALRGTDPVSTAGEESASYKRPHAAALDVELPCRSQRLPAGQLLGMTPALADHASAGFEIVFPDGRREILAWIRNYDPAFPETYWLARPVYVPPGSRLTVEAAAPCSVTLHMAHGSGR